MLGWRSYVDGDGHSAWEISKYQWQLFGNDLGSAFLDAEELNVQESVTVNVCAATCVAPAKARFLVLILICGQSLNIWI